jgi:hypothetical protein
MFDLELQRDGSGVYPSQERKQPAIFSPAQLRPAQVRGILPLSLLQQDRRGQVHLQRNQRLKVGRLH